MARVVEEHDLLCKDKNCRLCNPVNKQWQEEGFYGYQCHACTDGKTAFIILDNHTGELTPKQKETYKRLIEKHYPDLEPKGLADKRTNCQHWYES